MTNCGIDYQVLPQGVTGLLNPYRLVRPEHAAGITLDVEGVVNAGDTREKRTSGRGNFATPTALKMRRRGRGKAHRDVKWIWANHGAPALQHAKNKPVSASQFL